MSGVNSWRRALKKGLSLVIDTNDEYDVRHLLMEERSEEEPEYGYFTAFPGEKEESADSFFTIVDSISQYEIHNSSIV